jgi:ferredoxin-NADP reductase/predicted pyridoxine 5'-phosphate oxidase superfamily flavin-nucleotide-binding protein
MSTVSKPELTHEASPFHKGEIQIQERLGLSARMEVHGRKAIRALMPDQHREFFPLLPFILVGSVDEGGQPWASMLVARPGFVQAPDAAHLRVTAKAPFGDPLLHTLKFGASLGMLGIELHTRRRNRANGQVEKIDADGFTLAVQQSFGNCPQYIQGRDTSLSNQIDAVAYAKQEKFVSHSDRLDASAQALISNADTFFIASSFKGGEGEMSVPSGVDVSHRGGKPGFVRIDDECTLTIPDFVGNFFFNTLGNLLLEPRAGLLFVDFTNGNVLHLAGKAEIIWDGDELKSVTGADRLLRFRVTQAIFVEASLPLRWSAPAASPILARTGSWEDAARSILAGKVPNVYRRFRIQSAVNESATIRSLLLVPVDGLGVASHEPGQFLPIRISLPDASGETTSLLRTYTISDAPNGSSYRLSVKRESAGAASNWLHQATIGSELEALAPRGKFHFNMASNRPVVLLSAGVGITPMVAMLNTILVNGGRTRYPNRLIFIHGARNSDEHAFSSDLRALASKHSNFSLHIAYSNPHETDVLGTNHDSVGRVDIALVKRLLSLDDYEVYLCGPAAFMQSLHAALRSLHIPENQIHSESFGPAAVASPKPVKISAATPAKIESAEAVEVVFSTSGITAQWRPESGTLLELAEANGLSPAFSCRSGICGTCATKLCKGDVVYSEEPMAEMNAGEVLICCATPRPGPHLESESLRSGVTLEL